MYDNCTTIARAKKKKDFSPLLLASGVYYKKTIRGRTSSALLQLLANEAVR
jgi:hypothetical protein